MAPTKAPPRPASRPTSHEPANDPHRLARAFLSKNPWVYWNGLYLEYQGTKYHAVPERELRARLNGFLKEYLDADHAEQVRRYHEQLDDHRPPSRPPARLSVTTRLVSNVLQALEGRTLLPGSHPTPSRLSDGQTPNWLAVANGLLDLETGTLRPHTPDWFSMVCLPYAYEPAAKCERWLQVLQQNLEGDVERIAVLQEFFGYSLICSTDAQACLVLVGEGCNGKSVALAALHALLGDDHVSSVPLEDFGRRFAMAQTLGKLANVCNEIGELDKTAEGVLKAFVSGDRMTFEQKGRDPFTARPTARLVLSTNNVPRFADRSEGVWRRLLLLPFDRRVPEGERVCGMDKPEWWLRSGEVPGILNWALDGWRRLRDHNMRFTASTACRQALESHRLDSDPCRAFLLEHYAAAPQAGPIPTHDVYEHYRQWCEQNGYKSVPTTQYFGKQVRRVFRLEESRPHRFDDGVHKAWCGLARKGVTAVTPL